MSFLKLEGDCSSHRRNFAVYPAHLIPEENGVRDQNGDNSAKRLNGLTNINSGSYLRGGLSIWTGSCVVQGFYRFPCFTVAQGKRNLPPEQPEAPTR